MTHLLPERRRAEGIGYWGLSTMARWRWRRASDSGSGTAAGSGCASRRVLNLVMAGSRWNLEGQPPHDPGRRHAVGGGLLEWRVLIISFTLFLYSFGYGGITSFTAMYADANGVHAQRHLPDGAGDRDPVHAALAGRLGDRFGYKRSSFRAWC